LKPWKKFRKTNAVLTFSVKNTSGKSAFSFVSVFFVRAKKMKIIISILLSVKTRYLTQVSHPLFIGFKRKKIA
jgi:hypothetical protein